ncbi:MAG: hypothetical protein NTX57_17285, partial [Armatimonadetes bacterium]|nr:hypothetical protein [Armatimonadota bacterium]
SHRQPGKRRQRPPDVPALQNRTARTHQRLHPLGRQPTPRPEREGVTTWTTRPDSTMQDGTPVTVLMATDDKDPIRGKPRRTYVFAYGKQDKLLRRFYSEIYQPDGTVKKRTETFTNVQLNPNLDERLFAFVPPPGSQPFKPAAFPPAPLVPSLPENPPEVPDSLRFPTNPDTSSAICCNRRPLSCV